MPNGRTSSGQTAFSWLGRLLGSSAARSTAAAAQERRTAARRGVAIQARLIPEFGRSFLCTIVDVSLGGARIRFDGEAPLKLDTVRLVFFPSRHVQVARVRWTQGTDMGLEFVG
jgi:hypothetical protein